MNLSIKKIKTICIQKLRNLKSADQPEFWKVLNSSNTKVDCQALLQELYNYFKGVNDYQNIDTPQRNN